MLDTDNPQAEVEPTEPTNPSEPSEPGNPGGEPAAPQMVEIGGEKLPLDQATELVQLGRTFKPIRERYKDIDFEGMVPAFTKQSQLLRDPERLYQHLQTQFPEFRPAASAAPPPEEVKQTLDWLRSQGVQFKEDIDKTYAQRRQAEQYEERVGQLTKQHDGKDGLPKFVRDDVEAFMVKSSIFDPEAAYEQMFKNEILEAYAAKKINKKPKGTGTERGGAGIQVPSNGGKTPKFGSPEFQVAAIAAQDDGDND